MNVAETPQTFLPLGVGEKLRGEDGPGRGGTDSMKAMRVDKLLRTVDVGRQVVSRLTPSQTTHAARNPQSQVPHFSRLHREKPEKLLNYLTPPCFSWSHSVSDLPFLMTPAVFFCGTFLAPISSLLYPCTL